MREFLAAIWLCAAVAIVSLVVSERVMPSPVFAVRAVPMRAVNYPGPKDQSQHPLGDPLTVHRVKTESYRPLSDSMRPVVKKPQPSRVAKDRKRPRYARASW